MTGTTDSYAHKIGEEITICFLDGKAVTGTLISASKDELVLERVFTDRKSPLPFMKFLEIKWKEELTVFKTAIKYISQSKFVKE